MNERQLSDEQIAALLRRVENDQPAPTSVRLIQRAAVLDTFDATNDDVATLHIATQRGTRFQSTPQRARHRAAQLLGVAATLIVVIGLYVLTFARGDDQAPTSSTVSAPTLPPAEANTLFEGRVSFETPERHVATRRPDGSIWVSRANGVPTLETSVVLVPVEGRSVSESISELSAERSVRALRSTQSIGEMILPRWDINVQQPIVLDSNCVGGEQCLELVGGVAGSAITGTIKWTAIDLQVSETERVLVLAPAETDLESAAEAVLESAIDGG